MGDGRLGVVLVHGFSSGPDTWGPLRERIAEDESLGFVRPLPFTYKTLLKSWKPLQVIPEINTVADSLKEYLRTEGQPFDELMIVTHSMGGLVVQRYLARMLADGHGAELARIQRVMMLACPNDGSELLLSLRRNVFGRRGKNPQERELRPLNDQVADTRRTIVNQVLHAPAVSDRTCPIPFSVYAGESDGVVPVASARSVFPDAAALPGDHFTILAATTAEHRTFTTLRRLLLATRTGTVQGEGRSSGVTVPSAPGTPPAPSGPVAAPAGGTTGVAAGRSRDRAQDIRARIEADPARVLTPASAITEEVTRQVCNQLGIATEPLLAVSRRTGFVASKISPNLLAFTATALHTRDQSRALHWPYEAFDDLTFGVEKVRDSYRGGVGVGWDWYVRIGSGEQSMLRGPFGEAAAHALKSFLDSLKG